jgi:hypothetical protein
MLKNIFFILSSVLLSGCFSVVVNFADTDKSLLILGGKGKINLSTLNSSQTIKIIKTQYIGDTLFVSYKRGVFNNTHNANILFLKDETRFLKCANKLYRVEKGSGVIEIR